MSVGAFSSAQRAVQALEEELAIDQLLRMKDEAYDALLRKFNELKAQEAINAERREERAQEELHEAKEAARARESEAAKVIASLRQQLLDLTEQNLKGIKTPGSRKKDMEVLQRKEQELSEMTLQLAQLNRYVGVLQTKYEEVRTKAESAVKELNEKTQELAQQSEDASSIINTYRILTCMHVEPSKIPNMMRCSVVNRKYGNVEKKIVFDVEVIEDEGEGPQVGYYPRKVMLAGDIYPDYIKSKMKFDPMEAPLLLKNLLTFVQAPVSKPNAQPVIYQ